MVQWFLHEARHHIVHQVTVEHEPFNLSYFLVQVAVSIWLVLTFSAGRYIITFLEVLRMLQVSHLRDNLGQTIDLLLNSADLETHLRVVIWHIFKVFALLLRWALRLVRFTLLQAGDQAEQAANTVVVSFVVKSCLVICYAFATQAHAPFHLLLIYLINYTNLTKSGD